MPSFENKKQLKFVITLKTGKFGSSNNDQIILQGFRSVVDIDKAGGFQMGTMRAQIYGVSQQNMNSVTTLQWKPGFTNKNTVEVYAIDGPVETLVFGGNIVNAWADYRGIPEVFLHIQSQSAYFNQLEAVQPLSIKGGIDAALVMQRIANDMGLTFENNNVSVILTDVYLANTLTEQAKEVSRAANFDLYIDDKVLAITNRYAPRAGLIPLISKSTGLIGYPTFDSTGITFQAIFNPAITFGGSIKLETDIKQAEGEWVVSSIAHRLESEKPGGAWYSTIKANANVFAITGR